MTSIDWLIEMVSKMGYVSADIVEQAKEMHKTETERMYSEEEVLELLLKSKIETSNLYYEDMKNWFEQNKKD